jgi:Tfp pilus assembly protein PilW
MKIPTPISARECRALTIVELLITSTISAIVVGAVMVAFSAATRHFKAIANYGQIHGEGRLAVDRFAQDFRRCNDVTSWASTTLTLSVPVSFTAAGAVSSSQSIKYYKQASNLIRHNVTLGTSETLSNNVQTVTFTMYDRVGNSTSLTANCKGVQLDIRLRRTVQSTQQTEDFLSARLMSRNKP